MGKCAPFVLGELHTFNKVFRPMSMTSSSARAGDEREILAEKVVELSCVFYCSRTVFAQMYGYHANARIFADIRQNCALPWLVQVYGNSLLEGIMGVAPQSKTYRKLSGACRAAFPQVHI